MIARIIDPALDRLLSSWKRNVSLVRGNSRQWLVSEIMLADASFSRREAESLCDEVLRQSRATDGGRRSGRTLSMVMALPEGGAIIVIHTAQMRDYLSRMIVAVRGEDFFRSCRIVVWENVANRPEQCRGLTLPVFVDHAVGELPNSPLKEKFFDWVSWAGKGEKK